MFECGTLDNFIDVCESMKITEFDYQIGTEGLGSAVKTVGDNIMRTIKKMIIWVKGLIEKITGCINARKNKIMIPEYIPIEYAVDAIVKDNDKIHKLTKRCLGDMKKLSFDMSVETKQQFVDMLNDVLDSSAVSKLTQEDIYKIEIRMEEDNKAEPNFLSKRTRYREIPYKNLAEKLKFVLNETNDRLNEIRDVYNKFKIHEGAKKCATVLINVQTNLLKPTSEVLTILTRMASEKRIYDVITLSNYED